MKTHIPVISTVIAITTLATAPAAVVDVSGDLADILDNVVGAGNSARLVGDTKTFWPATTSTTDIDLNGHEFNIDTGNGNAQRYMGVISGSGALRITGRWDATWTPDAAFGGSASNSPQSVFISQGRASLGKDAGVDAFAGPITVTVPTVGISAIIQLENDEQINNSSTIDATSSSGAFSFLLDGHSETIAGLSMNADHTVDTGIGGALTLGALTVGGTSYGAGTYDSGNSSFVTGSGSISVVPETSVTVLGVIGLLGLLRRRRG